MRVLNRHSILNFISYFMIFAVGFLLLNKAVYSHTHKLEDGTTIQHAHPFKKSTDNQPFKSHTHNESDLLIIQQLNNFFFTIAFLFALIISFSKNVLAFSSEEKISPALIQVKQGRSPPSL